jgi:hypothetical protein
MPINQLSHSLTRLKMVLPLLMLLLLLTLQPRSLSLPTMCFFPLACSLTLVAIGNVAQFSNRLGPRSRSTCFALAHQELCDSQVTSNQAGYQQAANAAYDTASYDIQQETALAIANLATATASDRSTVANLTATNSSLSTEWNLANAKLNAVTAELSALQITMAAVCSTGTQQATATCHLQPPRLCHQRKLLLCTMPILRE